MSFKATCIQLNCQNNMAENLENASRIIRESHREGTDFVALPENTAFMSNIKEEVYANAWHMETHPALQYFQDLAATLNIWILIGSLAIKLTHSEKLANRSVLIDPKGEIRSFYDKIHLFDVDLKNGETHRESEKFEAGNQAVWTSLPWCNLGMSICYDLRFPELYRKLALAGTECITVPAAFTETTGKAHWHVLLRARAIETGCYIIAPAQTGTHPGNRKTFGHSLIIDPWGTILAEAGEKTGYITATIDPSMSDTVRRQLPNLKHVKL